MSHGLKFRWLKSLRISTLPAPVRGTLRALADYADGSGRNCYPSIATLAEETALSKRTVSRHLSTAERAGWIERVDRSRQCKSTLYRLLIPLPVSVPERSSQTVENPSNDRLPHDTDDVPPMTRVSSNQPTTNQLTTPSLTTEVQDAVAEHWKGKDGSIDDSLIGALAALAARDDWTVTGVRWIISTNTNSANTIGALWNRYRMTAWLSEHDARINPGVRRLLTERPSRPSSYAQPHEAYGPTRELSAAEFVVA